MSTYHGVIRFDADDDMEARRVLALKAAELAAEVLSLARVRQVLDQVPLNGVAVREGPVAWEEATQGR